MGDLSKNFNRSEFACKCGCGYDTVDAELVVVLQDIADHFGESVIINSGCRCRAHNKAEGGGEFSQHLIARGADIDVVGVSPHDVQEYLLKKYKNKYGIGRYNSFTHIDTRGTMARWDLRG